MRLRAGHIYLTDIFCLLGGKIMINVKDVGRKKISINYWWIVKQTSLKGIKTEGQDGVSLETEGNMVDVYRLILN